jgi:GT2 family glycosyltransferase
MMNSSNSKYQANQKFPAVSIVIVNYNGYQWLRLFIRSVTNTNYPEFEILLVDNGSTDESVDYVRKYWHHLVRIIELKDNKGFAEASNVGVRQARGEIVAFLNNDMEVERDWLKAAVEKLLSDKRAGAVQSKIMQYYVRNRLDCIGISVDKFGIVAQIGHNEADYGQYDKLPEIGGSSGGAMIVWKHILIKVGLFDDRFFIYYEDVDLSWRIKLSGYKILPAQLSVVYHVGSGTSKMIPSAFVTFHITKNYITLWLKNSRFKTLIIYWPVPLFMVVGVSFFDLVHRRYWNVLAHLKAILWVLFHINYVLKERHKVQRIVRKSGLKSDDILFISDKQRSSSNLFSRIKRGFHLICKLKI